MPGWQQFYTENHDQNFELLSVAMEVQGVQKALPWLEKAQATYVALVDNENKLGGQFNFNYIPLTILFDEKGRMDRGPQYFRESDPEVYQEIANWLRDGKSALTQQAPKLPFKAGGFESPEAELRFHLGALLIQNHQKEQALVQLKKALNKSPDNLIILKQIWAIEHPERFYQGDVDFDWQRQQFELRAKERQK